MRDSDTEAFRMQSGDDAMNQLEVVHHQIECDVTRREIPKGPWTHEPDRINWKSHGLDCMMVRNPSGFHWCGYVGVPEGHPLFGKDYDSVKADVHGGLTHSDVCMGHICHQPEPGSHDKIWWFGFDCAHGGDAMPGYLRFEAKLPKEAAKIFGLNSNIFPLGGYKTEDYVRAEVENLAIQISERA